MNDDTIYRKAAIDILNKLAKLKYTRMPYYEYYLGALHDAAIDIKALPSTQPERIRGEWQEITASDCSGYDPVLAGYDDPVVGYVCSVCHEGYEKEVMGKIIWNFCPNCGADMREE